MLLLLPEQEDVLHNASHSCTDSSRVLGLVCWQSKPFLPSALNAEVDISIEGQILVVICCVSTLAKSELKFYS